MQSQVKQWEESADARAVFLRCYMMMTENMVVALQGNEFKDPPWVDTLLRRFAERYFDALDAYETQAVTTPAAWKLAHDTSRTDALVLQKLLLGVNAHINYDLVLTLADLLQPEWAELHEMERGARYFDFCYVNDVIGRTIDVVQDTLLEPLMPGMDIVDAMMGRLDEAFVSRMITSWRDNVWERTLQLLDAKEPVEYARQLQQLEECYLLR